MKSAKTENVMWWTCGCRWSGQTIMPHYCPRHNAAPVIELRDETSGIANLKADVSTARTPLVVGILIVVAAFCLGTAAGIFIVEIF